jgi:uncharacterized protein DUF1707
LCQQLRIVASPLRASDDDRERVVREIREHFAAGRLSEEELDERVAAAYAARTESDLEAIRADLPVFPPRLPSCGRDTSSGGRSCGGSSSSRRAGRSSRSGSVS